MRLMIAAMTAVVTMGCSADRQPADDAHSSRRQSTSARSQHVEQVSETETTAASVAPLPAKGAGFDRMAAMTAINTSLARTASCYQADGPTGKGRAVLTIRNDGVITDVALEAPFEETEVGNCISDELLKASLEPFTLENGSTTLSVGKTFEIAAP